MTNNFYAIGNLTADVREVQGQQFLSGTIAINGKRKDGSDHSTFLPFVYFGQAKEAFIKVGKKGNQIFIEGSVSSYKNKDGHNTLSLTVRRYQVTNFKNNKEEEMPTNKDLDYGF